MVGLGRPPGNGECRGVRAEWEGQSGDCQTIRRVPEQVSALLAKVVAKDDLDGSKKKTQNTQRCRDRMLSALKALQTPSSTQPQLV